MTRSAGMSGAPHLPADRGPQGAWLPGPVGPGGGTPQLAIFDLDRTLVRGSSLAVLGRVLVRDGAVPAGPVVRDLLRHRSFARRGETAGEVHGLVGRLLALAAGREVAPLVAALERAAVLVEREAFDGARELLAAHRAAGDLVVIVSASPQELVGAVGRRLGADLAVGTRAEVIDGRITGRLDGPFCHGPGKLICLRAVLGPVGLDRSVAYSDSASDLPLLRACAAAVAVNPDRHLAGVARAEGWPVLRWVARRRPLPGAAVRAA